jgi:hypothetical protein
MRQQSGKARPFHRYAATAAAIAAVVAAIKPALAEQTGDAVTISLSGSTAIRNFTTSAGFTFLNPGTSITLNSGIRGAPVVYTAPTGFTTQVQLAQGNFTAPEDTDLSDGIGSYKALRIEWHEQGSVEGILELINDQIGSVNSISLTNRNASTGNPTWVNRNNFGGTGATVVPPPPGSATITQNGLSLTTSNYNTYTNYDNTNLLRPGRNTQGGQNRVQMAISDVTAVQGFSKTGGAAYTRAPGEAGYGKGNPALALAAAGDIQGLGAGGVRHELNDELIINMPATAKDPATGANFSAGDWNTAGLGNLDNRTVAITATLMVANPGTGLERLNRSDAQWLHATGRLANGADFNMTTRDVNSGTLNVAATNVGLDSSFAVGENDDNNGNAADGGTTKVRIGPGIRFSNKTSGGSQLRPTVQNARMSIGHLSMSDAIGVTKNSVTRLLRALDYRDDGDDISNASNNALIPGFADPASNTFVRASASTIVDGTYVIYQNQTYVTVKRPTVAEYGLDLIKGDNSGNDVRDVRDNVLNSVANFPAASIANPADALVQNSLILPQFMAVRKDRDGLNRSTANPSYNPVLSAAFLGAPSLTSKFNPDAPNTVTTGSGSNYGDNVAGASGTAPVGGAVPINDKNWLFGDFDQRAAAGGISGKGVRDYSDLSVAQQAQAALAASGLGTDWNAVAGSSATNVNALPAAMNGTFTKGDLIVLGDFDANGIFDGRDLYLMARGAALADSTSSTILTGAFADAVRKGVLRKNAALDLMQSTATAAQKAEASSDGGLEFVKEDVNRDGKTDLTDALIVDKFIGKDYRNIEDQLAASVTVGGVLKPISLVNVEFNDTGAITQTDLDLVNSSRLTLPGNESWIGTTVKTGPGTVIFARPSGSVTVAAGATLQIDAGQFTAGGAIDLFTESSNSMHLGIINNAVFNISEGEKTIGTLGGSGATNISPGASLTISGTQSHSAGATLNVSGRANLNTNAGTSATASTPAVANLSLNLSGDGAKVVLGSDQHLKSLNIDANATGIQSLDLNSPADPGAAHLLHVYAADLDAARATLTAAVLHAVANPEDGIYDSGLAAHPSSAIGVAKVADAFGDPHILIGPTRIGDLNLDGQVTISDFIDLASHFNGTGMWQEGDLNGDGQITISDFIDLASNFNSSYSGATWPMTAQESAMLSQFASSVGTTVPEPGVAIGVLVFAHAMTRRQRRR